MVRPKRTTNNLNRYIAIYGDKKYTNDLGEEAEKFGKLKSFWAEIIPQTGALQRQQADTIITNVTHKIKARYSALKSVFGDDINKLIKMEIRYKNHRFEIKYAIDPYFDNKFVEIFVQEVLP